MHVYASISKAFAVDVIVAGCHVQGVFMFIKYIKKRQLHNFIIAIITQSVKISAGKPVDGRLALCGLALNFEAQFASQLVGDA